VLPAILDQKALMATFTPVFDLFFSFWSLHLKNDFHRCPISCFSPRCAVSASFANYSKAESLEQ